jgi:hypothetical protein
MKALRVVAFSVVLSLSAVAPAAAQDHPVGQLDMYSARVSAAKAAELSTAGYDITDTKVEADGTVTITLVLSPAERTILQEEGVPTRAVRDARGQTSRERALAQAAGGYAVYRSWDEAGGIRDELRAVAKQFRRFVKLEVIGRTIQGRQIIALKVTDHANRTPDGKRPAVLYMSNQHAREWISVEVNRRLLHWFLDQRKAGNPEIVKLLKSTELWFIISANPDGYQYTFDHERLWRRNLRDNDKDGAITGADGVDPNRNYDAHWNYDNEGSSTALSSDTYRGTKALSEPETRAAVRLIDRIKPKFLVNYHSYGPLILYPQGWQVGTPDADNPIYAALAGTDATPGIPGFDPGISADELYVTNGETTDYADVHAGSMAFTPELEEGCVGCGFVFPDDEGLIQAEFEKTLPFDLDIARSATNPANPTSHLGNTVKPFYLSQTEVDPENGALAMFDFTFDKSYGDPQEVRVLAKRALGDVTIRYQINGGRIRSARTKVWKGGERYGPGKGTYYHVVGGKVRGTKPNDSVKVWFEARGKGPGHPVIASESFTYTAVSETRNPVLILSAEDYTGASPAQTPGPHYLSSYEEALAHNGIAYDVYDVDANGRTAPDALGVLSHYDAVVWYTGDDAITREPGWGPGNASRLALRELLEVRDYLNEGGKLLYTGKYAGHQYATGHGTQLYDPFENAQCSLPEINARCRPLPGSGDAVNDVLEYWFGASIVNEDAGIDPDTGDPFGVDGTADPFAGTSWAFNGADSAGNQDHDASFITTTGLLPVDAYPQFESSAVARYARPGGPFEPHTGNQYVYSQIADITYKRLTRTITVPAGAPTMSFWVSRDTELDWDFMFVEAHHVGADDWTTLPDVNGHTTDATGESCPAVWRDLHPFLDHYQTIQDDGTCSPLGTTGAWNAASGASGNWEQWTVDLAPYAGGQVEISIAYVSDWSTQGLGVFIDDIEVSTGEGSTSFETSLDGWTIPGQPAGSAANANDFIRTTPAGFPEGAVIATRDTLYMGFGFEGITDAATRDLVMGRAMGYLLP